MNKWKSFVIMAIGLAFLITAYTVGTLDPGVRRPSDPVPSLFETENPRSHHPVEESTW